MFLNILKTFLLAIVVATAAVAQPSITVTPSTINFGNTAVSSNGARQLEIRNTGNSDLIIDDFLINGNDASLFSLPGNPITPFVVNANVTRIIDIQFSPNSIGSKSAVLQIVNNDPFSDTLDVPLVGTGLAPDIQITPSSIQFDSVVVGGSAIRTLQISNLGNDALRIQDTSIVGANAAGFRFVTPPTLPIVIQPGANPRVFQIEFAPKQGGVNSAFLVLTSNDPTQPVSNIPLNGLGVFPDITVSALTLDYDDVVVGKDSTLSLIIDNEGVGELIITDADIVGVDQDLFAFTDPITTPITIQPGGPAFTLNVDFVPDSIGNQQAFLILTSNDPDENPVNITLTGTGIKPVISAAPPTANYGDVLVGTDSIITIAISNLGDSPLTITDTTFGGQAINQFAVLNMPPLPFTIPVGGAARQISIQFNPTSAGQKTANLRLTNNDVYRDPFILPLIGVGVEPDIGANPNPLAFGSREVGQSLTRTVNIRNDGGATLIINDTTFVGANATEFSLEGTFELPIEIEPGDDPFPMAITFSPQNAGSKTAALQLFSNDPDENPFSLNLTGTGIRAEIVVTPDSVNFGNVRVGRDSTIQVRLSNSGTAQLRISEISLQGPQAGEFRLDSLITLPIIIEPGGSQRIYRLHFYPEKTALAEAEVFFSSNDPETPELMLPLAGTGALPDIDILIDSLDFGEVVIGADTLIEFPVFNRGGVPLTITQAGFADTDSSFMVDSSSLAPQIVAANDSLLMKLRFSPDSVGTFSGRFSLVSDDPDEPLSRLSVVGSGVLPEIVLIDSALSFGPVKIQGDSVRTIRIANSGTATLIIDSVQVTGLNQGQFAVADSTVLPFFVPANGDTFAFPVQFTPLFGGQKMATITLFHNDPVNGPTAVSLRGRGVEGPRFNDLAFSAASLNQPMQVTVEVTSDTTLQSVILQYALGGQSGYLNSLPMTIGTDQLYRAVIDGSQVTGAGLKTRITATDDFPVRNRVETYHTVAIPQDDLTHSFTNDQVNRWQMFSVPYQTVLPGDANISEMLGDLGPENEFVWKVFRSDTSGQNSNYFTLEQLETAGDFGRMLPGNAFWLFLRDSDDGGIPTRNLTFPAMTTVPLDSFLITVEPGWNQIANPYAFSLNWSRFSGEGKDSLQAYRWDGSAWNQPLSKSGWTPLVRQDFQLEPWQGIAVRNTLDNPVTLVVYPDSASAGVGKLAASEGENWQAAFVVEGQNNFDVSIIGMTQTAAASVDRFDYPHPGRIEIRQTRGYLSVAGNADAYSSSFLPISQEGGAWYYTVESSHREVVLRRLTQQELPAGFQLWVYDSKYRRLSDLQAGSSVALRDIRDNESRRFVIIAGTPAYLEKSLGMVEHLQPRGFELGQNFPNPFNPTTRIRFQIPSEQTVLLEVYDLLGRKVRTLVDAYRTSGYYEIEWDGKNEAGFETSSGIYFYRLQLDQNQIAVRRMLKLK